MAQKIPPPPMLAGLEWEGFNRWLLELTSILNDGGGIDPSQVAGLDDLTDEVDNNTAAIGSIQGQVNALSFQVGTLQLTTNDLVTRMGSAETAIAALQVRNQVFNGAVAPGGSLGVVGDWYSDTVAKHIYVKTAVATWTQIV